MATFESRKKAPYGKLNYIASYISSGELLKKIEQKKFYYANVERYQNLMANARLAMNIQRYSDIF